MRVEYYQTVGDRDYYRVLWRGERVQVYIPTGLLDSMFRRSLLARALCLVRAKKHRLEGFRSAAIKKRESFLKRYPIIADLVASDTVDIGLTDNGMKLELESGDRGGYRSMSRANLLDFISELQDIADKMPTEQ